jgi:uncharacterized protein (TIGR00251 family)
MSLEIVEKNGSVSFLVRVQPRASCDEFAGEYQSALKIRLTAPPVDDRANQALRKFLASRLNVPMAAVRIVAGEHSRTKRLEINGVSPATIRGLVV